MAAPNGPKTDTFPDLKEKRKLLAASLSDWKDIEERETTIDDPEREDALKRINELLGVIKSEINVYWGPNIDPDHEVRILIADKQTNPYNKQVEDIEGDVHRMEGI
jgi:hypothetical protein